MTPNRRSTFRAALATTREATLWVERRGIDVRIVDESSDGLCLSCRDCPQVEVGSELQLETEDGDWLRAQVVRVQQLDGRYHIGLKRTNFQLPRSASASRRSLSPLSVLVGITLGFYAGYLLSTDVVRRQLAAIPTVSQFLQR